MSDILQNPYPVRLIENKKITKDLCQHSLT